MVLPARLAPLTAAAAGRAARRHWLRLVHGEAASTVLMSVELADRLARALGIAHFNERKSTRLAGGTVADDIDAGDLPGRLEQRLQIGFGGFVRKISHVQ